MLAMRFFGNGYGMAAPFFNQTFYWLVDTFGQTRAAKNGRFYTFMGGLGAQLHSFEWKVPKPGTRRRLAGMEFEVFNVSRGRWGIMWSVAWALVDFPRDIDKANAKIREIKEKIGNYSDD